MAAPRKQSKPKTTKISVSDRDRWESIIKSVSTQEIPVQFLKSMTVNLADGTKVNIDIRELLEQGHDPFIIEEKINSKLDQLDEYIKNVDLYICADTVASVIGPITKDLLKGL